MTEFGPKLDKQTIAEINEAGAEVEREALGKLCQTAFGAPDQLEAQGISPLMQLEAKAELFRLGYDVEAAQRLANDGFSAGQILSRLKFRPEVENEK